MDCPNQESLLLLAAGETARRDRRRILDHLDRCDRCREEYEVAGRAVRVGFPALMEERGFVPQERGTRVEEILCSTRSTSSPASMRRLYPTAPRRRGRLALAAAVLAIAFVTARYLGDWDAKAGRLELVRGAPVAWGDGGSLEVLEGNQDLSPGDLVAGVDDSEYRIVLSAGGEVRMYGASLSVMGRDGEGPALWLARGVMYVTSPAGSPVRVGVGDHVVAVDGEAEFVVEPGNDARAFAWARERSTEVRMPSGAFAAAETAIPPSVRIHALAGTTRPISGVLPKLQAGEETSRDGDRAVWSGMANRYARRRQSQFTTDEQRLIALLLSPGRDMVESLLSVAENRHRPEEERGLALWTLAEIGDPRAESRVTAIAESGAAPPSVRAAAWRTRGCLGVYGVEARKALETESAGAEPVVEEAIVQSLGRCLDDDIPGRLASFASRTDRPAFLRALAAATAHSRGHPVPTDSLTSILAADDWARGWPLVATMLDAREADHQRILLDVAHRGGPGRNLAFRGLLGNQVAGAEDLANRLVGETEDPELARLACLYLARVNDPRLPARIRDLIATGDRELRFAAASAVWFLFRRDLVPWESLFTGILDDPASPNEHLQLAVRGLEGRLDRERAFRLADRGDPELRSEVFEALRISGAAGDPSIASAYRDLVVRMLDSTSLSDRKEAWREIGRIDPVWAVERVERIIDRGLPPVSDELLHGLQVVVQNGASPALGRRAVEATLAILRGRTLGESQTVGLRVLGTLSKNGVELAHEALVRLVDDPWCPLAHRVLAARALAADPEPSRRAELFVGMLDWDSPVARAAADILLNRSDAEQVRSLGARLSEAGRTPYCRAVGAILASSSEGDVREAIRDAGSEFPAILAGWCRLGSTIARYREPLRRMLADADRTVRRVAALRLAELADAAPGLVALERSDDPFLRLISLAVRLPAAPAGDIEGILDRVAAEMEAPEFAAARRHLRYPLAARLGLRRALQARADAEGIVPLSVSIRGSLQRVPEVQTFLLDANGAGTLGTEDDAAWNTRELIDSEAARSAARGVIRGGEPGSREHAAQALESLGDRTDVPSLLRLCGSPSIRERTAAARALGSLTGMDDGWLGEDLPGAEEAWAKRRFALDAPVVGKPLD